ncbi:MAG: 50S ribosomal protein L31e, partial [Candidatus Woesearchaeota archaeon]
MIERTYNIPLRKEFMKVPKYKKAKKAVKAVKEFLSRHLKQDDLDKIKIGEKLNLKIWEHGIKNPPHHIKVNAIKTD